MKSFLVKLIKWWFAPLLYLILGLKIMRARRVGKLYVLSPQNYATDKHVAQRYERLYKIIRLLFFVKDLGIEVLNIERIPKVPVLFLSNHKSNLDSLLLFKVIYENNKLPLVSFVAKTELKDKYYGYLLDLIDVVFVNRANPRHALQGLEVEAVKILKNNRSLCIFPESTRVVGAGLGSFQPGAMIPAYKSLASVVPVAIYNSEGQLWDRSDSQRKFNKPKSRTVSINFGHAIKAPQFINLNPQQAIEMVRQQVQDLLHDIVVFHDKKIADTVNQSIHGEIISDVKKMLGK